MTASVCFRYCRLVTEIGQSLRAIIMILYQQQFRFWNLKMRGCFPDQFVHFEPASLHKVSARPIAVPGTQTGSGPWKPSAVSCQSQKGRKRVTDSPVFLVVLFWKSLTLVPAERGTKERMQRSLAKSEISRQWNRFSVPLVELGLSPLLLWVLVTFYRRGIRHALCCSEFSRAGQRMHLNLKDIAWWIIPIFRR